jgi:SET domain-containing protein
MEYAGERINRREAKRRSNARSSVYLYKLDNYWALDGARGGSGAEYVNHSCNPNLIRKIIGGRIYYRSQRQIAPGQELTIDYSLSPSGRTVRCHCGASNCRGTVNRPMVKKGVRSHGSRAGRY